MNTFSCRTKILYFYIFFSVSLHSLTYFIMMFSVRLHYSLWCMNHFYFYISPRAILLETAQRWKLMRNNHTYLCCYFCSLFLHSFGWLLVLGFVNEIKFFIDMSTCKILSNFWSIRKFPRDDTPINEISVHENWTIQLLN